MNEANREFSTTVCVTSLAFDSPHTQIAIEEKRRITGSQAVVSHHVVKPVKIATGCFDRR